AFRRSSESTRRARRIHAGRRSDLHTTLPSSAGPPSCPFVVGDLASDGKARSRSAPTARGRPLQLETGQRLGFAVLRGPASRKSRRAGRIAVPCGDLQTARGFADRATVRETAPRTRGVLLALHSPGCRGGRPRNAARRRANCLRESSSDQFAVANWGCRVSPAKRRAARPHDWTRRVPLDLPLATVVRRRSIDPRWAYPEGR